MLCTKCSNDKPESEFYRDAKRPKRNFLTYWCRPCFAKQYADNRERQKKTSHRARVKRVYGLELEEYDRLIAQGCSVCGGHERMCLDHCHASNAVRAPLCHNCNLALGHTFDDPQRLRDLADYLEAHRALV